MTAMRGISEEVYEHFSHGGCFGCFLFKHVSWHEIISLIQVDYCPSPRTQIKKLIHADCNVKRGPLTVEYFLSTQLCSNLKQAPPSFSNLISLLTLIPINSVSLYFLLWFVHFENYLIISSQFQASFGIYCAS